MNVGRFVGAAIGVGIVRTLLNYLFYGVLTHEQWEQLSSAHPGMFREVIPAFITLDFLVALVFVYLFVKVGAALGGGVKGGVCLGLFVAVLSPVAGDLYQFFSVTFLSQGMIVKDILFQLGSHVIQGVVAAKIYKS